MTLFLIHLLETERKKKHKSTRALNQLCSFFFLGLENNCATTPRNSICNKWTQLEHYNTAAFSSGKIVDTKCSLYSAEVRCNRDAKRTFSNKRSTSSPFASSKTVPFLSIHKNPKYCHHRSPQNQSSLHSTKKSHKVKLLLVFLCHNSLVMKS